MLNFSFSRFLLLALINWGALPTSSPAQTTPDASGLVGASQATMTSGPAPMGKPWEPAWGFWPSVPMAWQQTHNGFVSQIKQGPPVKVVFLGDSITKGWAQAGKDLWAKLYAPEPSFNLGIGGDTTRQTLWRMDHGTLDGVSPKLVVLMIGVNNIFTGTGTNDEIVQGIEANLKEIQAKVPGAKIILLGILPLGNGGQNARVKAIDAVLGKLATTDIRFLNMSDKFEDSDGKILPDLYQTDGTHLKASGYQAWADAMQPLFDEMTK